MIKQCVYITSILAMHCEVRVYITDFILFFILQENKWMKQFLEDEQKSRKELERVVRKISKQKNDCSWDDGGHWTDPLTHRRLVCVWFRLMSAPCSWWDWISRARRSPFSVLRCVFIFQSPIAESDPLTWLHRWSSMINPSSGSQPERTRSDPIGLGCWSKENKEKKRRHCDHSPANGTTSDNSYTSFFHLDADRNSEAIKSNSVSCMHHCYQGDHFLSLTFFLEVWFLFTRKKL